MWSRPENPVKIQPSQLKPGVFVWLDVGWQDHPFFTNKFRITSQAEINQIIALGLPHVYYYPNKSTSAPAPVPMPESAPVPVATTPALEAVAAPKISEKKALLQKQKDAAARADRGWERASNQVREVLLDLGRQPKKAGAALSSLTQETAKMISGSDEVLLHLLGDKNGSGPQFHALNVMTLSMVLGKAMNLSESDLGDLAMGALAHDAGLGKVPLPIIQAKNRQRHEEAFYREHCQYGVEFAKAAGVFSQQAINIIQDHHEFVDGSGYPAQKTAIAPLASIVAVVNRYDELCSPDSPAQRSLMPAEALAHIYAKENGKFDKRILNLLIRILGVYPPGTIVALSDGLLGLVVSPGKASLRPKVLIYEQDLPKDEAAVADLSDIPDLKIDESIRPETLPPDVLKWLNPRQRLSYFFSVEQTSLADN